MSQHIAAASLSGLDFCFLARPKAEQTGYKLLNELSLELFLASGPVHHRAVADITLQHTLSHPITLELFKDSLTRTGTQEALAFWLDIQRYKQLESEELRRTVAEAMTACFLYSDAAHPLPASALSHASREGVMNVVLSNKSPKRVLFHFVEQELLLLLAKEHANYATTTSFKVGAFLLGHSSYRPSTRIKTLNAGGAVVGAGGAMVQMTQLGIGGVPSINPAAAGMVEHSNTSAGGGAGGVDRPKLDRDESSVGGGGLSGGIGGGGGLRSQLNVDIKAARGAGASAAPSPKSAAPGGAAARSLFKTVVNKVPTNSAGSLLAAPAAGGTFLQPPSNGGTATDSPSVSSSGAGAGVDAVNFAPAASGGNISADHSAASPFVVVAPAASREDSGTTGGGLLSLTPSPAALHRQLSADDAVVPQLPEDDSGDDDERSPLSPSGKV